MDHLLRLVNSKKTIEAADNVKLFSEDSSNYDFKRSYRALTGSMQAKEEEKAELLVSSRQSSSVKNTYKKKSSQISEFYKFVLLWKRGTKNLLKDKKLFLVFNVQMFLLMVITIACYVNISRDYTDPVNLRNRYGSLFFIAICYYCCLLLNSAFSMVFEAPIIYKELSADHYGYGAYYWSKSLVDLIVYLPPILIQLYLVASYLT